VIRGAWDTEFEASTTYQPSRRVLLRAGPHLSFQSLPATPPSLVATPHTLPLLLQGGIYHGRIIMPAEYPFKPPAFVMLTPSGRFETGVKICLSISSHHPESWQPSWSVRSALVALVAFMQTPGNGALGSLEHPADTRREAAVAARIAPPRHANAERQALIASLHQRMLEMEDRSRRVYKHDSAQATTPPSDETVQEEKAAESSGCVAPALAPEHTDSGAAASRDALPSEQQLPRDQPEGGVLAQELAVPVDTTVPAEPPEEGLRLRRETAPAHPPPAVALPRPRHHHQPQVQLVQQQSSWEDRGLTYLAILLAFSIVALLLRKALLAVTLESRMAGADLDF
jgi:ubiquitin-conjugating enzyme E2 J1